MLNRRAKGGLGRLADPGPALTGPHGVETSTDVGGNAIAQVLQPEQLPSPGRNEHYHEIVVAPLSRDSRIACLGQPGQAIVLFLRKSSYSNRFQSIIRSDPVKLRWNHTIGGRPCGGYGRCRPAPVWIASAVLGERRVVCVPLLPMGQYFKAVNLDKREVVCPWCIGGGAKLWEWAANPQGAVLTLLLRKSSAGGGGDYYGYRPQRVDFGADGDEITHQAVMQAVRSVALLEGQPIPSARDSIVGRWAGDRVALVGDYDDSRIWEELPTFRNISAELVAAWNDFIEIGEMKMELNPTCSCQEDR